MRAQTIITLHTEGNIFVLCQAINVWTEYTILLFQIWFYTAVFYGVLHRISPETFLHLKIQLETATFEPPGLPSTNLMRYQLSCPDWIKNYLMHTAQAHFQKQLLSGSATAFKLCMVNYDPMVFHLNLHKLLCWKTFSWDSF